MSGKEWLSQIPLPPRGIFTHLLLDDATFKQSCEDGLSCLKLRSTESRRAAQGLWSVTQLMTQGPRGMWTKAALRCPCGREKQALPGTWSSAGKTRRQGKQLTPCSLSPLPTLLRGLGWDCSGRAGTLPSRVHVSVPHHRWPMTMGLTCPKVSALPRWC